MVNNLYFAMTFTLRAEGGYTNDDGGPTMDGVTQTTYNSWRQRSGLGLRDVRLITSTEVAAIMNQEYWLPARCDTLPTNLSICQFDWAFNGGPTEAVKTLQRVIGTTPDGVWGPNTQEALKNALAGDQAALVEKYLTQRDADYHQIVADNPGDIIYEAGWENRVNDLRAYLRTF